MRLPCMGIKFMSVQVCFTHKPYTHKFKILINLKIEKPCQFSPMATFCDNHRPDWDFGIL